MPAKRIDPRRVKLHRSYSVGELAKQLAVHKGTVRNWQGAGLEPVEKGRPVLFQGATVRAFLAARNAGRKRPCPSGTMFCFRCREARQPALGMVDYIAITAVSGNLRAICAECDTIMHRRARHAALAAIMPGLDIQMAQALPRLKGSPLPSLNSDLEGEGTT